MNSDPGQKPQFAWLPQLAQVCALALVVVPSLGLLGWGLNSQILTRVHPSFVAMNPLTGTCLICAGIALWCVVNPEQGRSAGCKRTGLALGVIVLTVGAVRAADWILDVGLGLDHVLFSSRLRADIHEPSNSMAPNTALALFLCGLSLLMVDVETDKQFRPAQSFAVLSGFIGLLAIIGYSYSALCLSRVGTAIPMALNTAVCLCLFTLGFMAARPASGVMRILTSQTAGGAVARRLLPVALLLPWLLGGILVAGDESGFFERQAGIAMFVVISIIVFSLMIWWTARLLHATDRARELADARLREASADLERSNADLQQFASVASHDLQEPLRMVSSYLELLSRRAGPSLDEESKQFMGYAVEGAERMRRLIQDLLEYSRVEARGRSLESTSAEQALQNALTNLELSIRESGAVVRHEPLPTVLADPIQLTQLFQNLIGNALKFRGKSPPVIDIAGRREGNEWVLSVRDNGIGIDPKNFSRIFVIFQRLHSRKEYSGTGIGLAICKRIVERHGGKIWVESKPGEGATFYFTIPMRDTNNTNGPN